MLCRQIELHLAVSIIIFKHLWSYVTSVFFPIFLLKKFGENFQNSSQISWIYTWKIIQKFPKTFVARLWKLPKNNLPLYMSSARNCVFRKHMILCDKWMQFGSSNKTWSSVTAIWVLDGIEHVHSVIHCYDIEQAYQQCTLVIFNIGSSNHA
jgi:hypothetical protein